MPHRHEKERKLIPAEKDRRRKLLPEEVAAIERNEEGLSSRALARQYGVSRRTIQFILDPKKREENLKRRAERGGSKAYYDAAKHAEFMKRHRHHKKALDDAGELIEPDAGDDDA